MEGLPCTWQQVHDLSLITLKFASLFMTSPSHCFSITSGLFHYRQSFADQKQTEVVEFLLKAGAKRLSDRWGNVPQ